MSSPNHNRRDFLKSSGRFALTVPPAMTVLLSTSLSSPAIARSTGGQYGGYHSKRSGGHKVRRFHRWSKGHGKPGPT